MRKLLDMIGLGPTSAGRQLVKDAVAILDNTHKVHGSERLEMIAKRAAEEIAEVHERGIGDPKFYKQGVRALRTRNRAAQQRNDQPVWTAGVLATIYLQAELLGPPGDAARSVVTDFLAEWRVEIKL